MKAKAIRGFMPTLFLVIMLILAFNVAPVSAKKVTYRAYGTLDEYMETTSLTASLYRGVWSIRVEDGEVTFRGWYLELNEDEEIPGTLDSFRLVLADVTEPEIDDGVCTVNGFLVLHKIGWDNPLGPTLPGYRDLPGPWYSARPVIGEVTITIDEDIISIAFGSGKGIEGSTRFIYC